MRRSVLLSSVMMLAFAVSAAEAGIREKGFELGVYGGSQSGDDEADVEGDVTYGFKIGYNITRKLALQFDADFTDTTQEYSGMAGSPAQPANQVPYSTETDTSFQYYSFGLTANFLTERDGKTFPYANVGVGMVTQERGAASVCTDLNKFDSITCADVNSNGTPVDPNQNIPAGSVEYNNYIDEKDTGALISMAVGARTFFAPWFAVRYEIRYWHHDAFNENQDNLGLMVGASFALGGKK